MDFLQWKNFGKTVLFGALLSVGFSCGVNTFDDVEKTKLTTVAADQPSLKTLVSLPTSVSLGKVDMYLEKGSATTGTVTVSVKNSATLAIVGSVTVSANSIASGFAWNTFNFSSPLTLTRGQKYQLHITRSDPHNYAANNYIFWRTSSGGVDAYPNGINDVYPSWTLDYAFRTYINNGLDQQQTQTNYGFFVGNDFTRWQEFLADYPKVTLRYLTLNLSAGSAATGTFTLQIRSADGSTILAQETVSASYLGLGSSRTWDLFRISASLYRDQTYRLYIIRSAPHNYAANDYIFWHTSSGGVDAYPDGINDVYPSWTLDYAFRTYSALSGLDQHQDLNTYGFFVGNVDYRWQEFVPRNQ